MLTTSANFKIDNEGIIRDINITPLFLQNHDEPWQPNEIYEIIQTFDVPYDLHQVIEPLALGKIIVSDHMDWHYEGEGQLSEAEVEQIARFVLSQI